MFGDFFQHPWGIYTGKRKESVVFIQRKEVKSMAVMKINNDKDYITGKSKYKDQNALQNVYQYMIDQKNSYK